VVGDKLVGAKDVVSISRTFSRHLILEHNALCFYKRELGSFDEVRKVRPKKRQG
jgi:hypothetical protein